MKKKFYTFFLILLLVSNFKTLAYAGSCWSGTLTTTHTTTAACGVNNQKSVVGNGANLTINHNISNNQGGGTGRNGDAMYVGGGGTIVINNNATVDSKSQFAIQIETGGITLNNGVDGVIDSDGFRAIQWGGGATSGTIDNLGTIGTSATPTGINSQGSGLTLNNSQGGSNGLQFMGNLPDNYNIVINSTTDYGKLISYSNNWNKINGTMDVGIDSRSSVAAGTYQDVFSARLSSSRDFASSHFDSLTGTFDTYNWELTSRTVSDIVYWDLTFTSSRTSYTTSVTTTKLSKIAEVFENINTRGNKSSLTSNLDSLSDTALAKALKQMKGITVQKTIGQSVRSNNSFKRAMTAAIKGPSFGQLVQNNFASLSFDDVQNYYNPGVEKINLTNDFTLSDIANIYSKRNLLQIGAPDNSFYLRTFGGVTDQEKVGDDIGYESTTAGFVFGNQTIIDNLQAGWGLGFSTTGLDYDEGYGLNNTHSLHANFFANKEYRKFDTSLNLGSFVSKNNSTRNVTEGSAQTLKSDRYELGFDLTGGISKKINLGGWVFNPTATINTAYVLQDDIDESGGDLALKIKTDNLLQIKPELGFNLDREFSNNGFISKGFNLSLFGSEENKLDGADSTATIKDTGDGYALTENKKRDQFVTAGLGYSSINQKNNSQFLINAFGTQNTSNDMNSSLISFTYNKKF
mgnify:FL=1